MRKKVEMTNAEVLNLFNVVSSLNVQGKAKFAFALAKTRQYLKPAVAKIEETRSKFLGSEKYQEYIKRQQSLLKVFAVNADGTPCTRQDQEGRINRTVPLAKQGEFLAASESLTAEYQTELDAINKKNEEFIAVLNDKVEVEIYQIPLAQVPDTQIPQDAFNILYVLILEDEAEAKGEAKP